MAGIEDLSNYALTRPQGAKSQDKPFPMLYRLTLDRTLAAQPGNRSHRDRDLLKPWLWIKDAVVLPRPDCEGLGIPFRLDDASD